MKIAVIKAGTNRSDFIKSLLIAVTLVAIAGLYYHDFNLVVRFILVVTISVFGIVYSITNIFSTYLIILALIPISIDFPIIGSAKLTLPSEGWLIVIIPLFILFQKKTRSFKNAFLHPISILLLTDLSLQIITSLTSTHVDISLKRVLIKFIFYLGFFLIPLNQENIRNIRKIWMAYAIGLIPVMYLILRNHYHHNFNPRVVFSITQPYFNDHTLYGASLAFIIPVVTLFTVKYKTFTSNKLILAGLIVLLITLLLSEGLALSRAAILSLLIAAIFSVALYYRITFKTLIIGILLLSLGVISFRSNIYELAEKNEAVSNDGQISNHFSSVTNVQSDASNLERINRWICAIRMFQDKPLTGFGPGTYQFEYNRYQTTEYKTYISTNSGDKGNAHSEYLTYLSENGLFGAILFLLLVLAGVFCGMQNHYLLENGLTKTINLGVLLGFITFAFHGIFNSFLDQSKMAFLVYGSLATFVVINIHLKANSDASQKSI